MNRVLFSLLSVSSAIFAGGLTNFDGPSPVPEPSTYLMMAAGVGALAFARYRKSKNK